MEGPTTRLRLRVVPGAGRSEIVGRYGEAWKVRVAAAPERGKANDAVVALLTDTLEVPGGSVELLAGQGSRDKVVGVRGLSRSAADARLEAVAAVQAGAR
jgi:uncharacterized protein (TIGR00251 family)